MCQSWLHFLMHHQQMWLLWVPFHRATPLSAEFLASRLTLQTLCGLRLPNTHIHIHLPRHHLLTSSYLSSFPPPSQLVLQPSASTCLFGWFSLNLFHILPGSYFWLLCSQCLHYQEYISCQFIRWLNTTRDSLVGKFELHLKRMLIPLKKVLSPFCDDFFHVDLSLQK